MNRNKQNDEIRNEIRHNVEEWTAKNIGNSFSFRQHQLETIINIIYNVIQDFKTSHKTHVIEAPTGSGKSLLCIISAGVLSEYYKKTSYILCSDLFLYGQYENFIKQHNLKFGYLKGQTGNYFCDKNGEDMRNAECRIAKMSWSSLYNEQTAKLTGFSCAKYCHYIKERQKAQNSKVTLMTYQLYFYMINVVNNTIDDKHSAPFKQRDIIFCDECHNIPSIIQSQCTPIIKFSDLNKLIKIYEYNNRLQGGLFDDDTCKKLPWESEDELKNQFTSLWGIMSGEDNDNDLEVFYDYVNLISTFSETISNIEDALAVKQRSKNRLDKDDIKLYKITSWYRNYGCLLSDFKTSISDCGAQYLIKKHNIPITDEGELSVSYNCAKEDYMCWKYLINTSKNNVLMSATVGLKESFDDNIGMKYTYEKKSYMEKIPSTFDFSKSPILVSSRWKMSYNFKDISFPHIKETIYNIIRQYKDFRGIIQTGNYNIAKKIYDDAPKDIKQRFQLYNSSSEKHWTIEMHKAIHNSVLIGPTLIEGIDLPDDLCRFIIIAKIPYPDLKDKLVQAKLKLFPKWYNSETANNVIQGIGRGNRNKTDWCVTYIIDGCFNNLYNKTISQFPNEMQLRIKHI